MLVGFVVTLRRLWRVIGGEPRCGDCVVGARWCSLALVGARCNSSRYSSSRYSGLLLALAVEGGPSVGRGRRGRVFDLLCRYLKVTYKLNQDTVVVATVVVATVVVATVVVATVVVATVVVATVVVATVVVATVVVATVVVATVVVATIVGATFAAFVACYFPQIEPYLWLCDGMLCIILACVRCFSQCFCSSAK